MAASGVMLVIDYKNGLKDVRRNLTPVRFRLITVQAVWEPGSGPSLIEALRPYISYGPVETVFVENKLLDRRIWRIE